MLNKARNFVEHLFKDKLSSEYLYHNFVHTSEVVEKAEEILKHSEVSSEDYDKVLLALWFHDIGYVVNCQEHEKESAKILKEFLANEDVTEEYIAEVSQLILATDKYHTPENFLEKVVKDADTAHIAFKEYSEKAKLLRKEWEILNAKQFTTEEWNALNLNFLQNTHQYYTDYAKENWEPKKQKNIKKLKKKIEKKELENKDVEMNVEKKEIKETKPDRSVDTLFRVTLSNHTRLSDIADSKANILLSVNAIIISVCLSVLIPKLDAPKNSHLVIPTFLLILSSVLTIIFAILSTKPNVTNTTFTNEDVKARKVNLLFFGNFHKMTLENYQEAMQDMIKDREYIHNSLVKDLYFLGSVLDRKYKLLSITYKIFMAGIIISVLSFAYAFVQL